MHIAFISFSCENLIISGISCRFQQLSQSKRQVSYALLTRPPSSATEVVSNRLACVKHSVSVHPEPGSNSSFKFILKSSDFVYTPFIGCVISDCYLHNFFLTYFSIRLLMSFKLLSTCLSSVFPADKNNYTTIHKVCQQLFLFFKKFFIFILIESANISLSLNFYLIQVMHKKIVTLIFHS